MSMKIRAVLLHEPKMRAVLLHVHGNEAAVCGTYPPLCRRTSEASLLVARSTSRGTRIIMSVGSAPGRGKFGL